MHLRMKWKPEGPLIICLIWCCIIQRLALPLSQLWVTVITILLCAFLLLVYRKHRYEVEISQTDAKVFLGFVLLNIIAHWSGLFYSLGGDELYHANRALPLESLYRDLQPAFSRTSMESFRSSMWKLLDPRHMNVIDLWRALSFSVITLVALACALVATRRITDKHCPNLRSHQVAGWTMFFAISACYGLWMNLPAEVHPPGRLIPLLLSTLIFGYNSFAFRIPGILALACTQWALMRYLRERAPQQPHWWHATVCASIGFIPTVFYSSEAVEPSIYGFCAYIFVVLFVHKYFNHQRREFLVAAAIAAAIGTLCRQSAVITWGLIALGFASNRKNWQIGPLLLVFAPLIIDIPYLYSVSKLGHPAVGVTQQAKLDLLSQAIESGVAIMSAANSTTLPWLIITAIALAIWIRKPRWQEAMPLLLAIPSFVLFHTIWQYLWGLGRYQAEYIAPFIAFLLVFACSRLADSLLKYGCAVLAIGMVSTLEVNSNLSLDINYHQWPRMRITTSANFPYRETLGTLKRAEVGGNFVILGGSPIYNKSVLWLSGFSFWESARWEYVQNVMTSYLAQPRPPVEVRAFAQANGIQALVVQSGTRRELQHREGMPGLQSFISSLERVPLDSKSYFYKVSSYGGEHGGVLTIYRPRD